MFRVNFQICKFPDNSTSISVIYPKLLRTNQIVEFNEYE